MLASGLLPRGKAFAFVEQQRFLLGTASLLLGLRDGRDEFGAPAARRDLLRGLSRGVQFPVAGRDFVRRVEDRSFEELVGHALHSLRWLGSEPRYRHGRGSHIAPRGWMASEQQHLVALGRVEENPLHLFESLVVAVHERIVQDDQGRAPRFFQQVGVGQATDYAHLLAGAETQAANWRRLSATATDTGQPPRSQVVVNV